VEEREREEVGGRGERRGGEVAPPRGVYAI